MTDSTAIHGRNCATVVGGPCDCGYRKVALEETAEKAVDRNSRWFGPTLGEALGLTPKPCPNGFATCDGKCWVSTCPNYKAEPFTETIDLVNHPPHYTAHPSGVECIAITEHMNFCIGNAVKYLWRSGLKDSAIEDLKKARWYIDREIARLEAK